MPAEFYQVGPPGEQRFDELGGKEFARDWAAWPTAPDEDVMLRSQFNLFYRIGWFLFRDRRQALDYALGKVALVNRRPASIQEFQDERTQRHLFRYFEEDVIEAARIGNVPL
jgi:hypothetical protein